jgi:hypothetical protein
LRIRLGVWRGGQGGAYGALCEEDSLLDVPRQARVDLTLVGQDVVLDRWPAAS